MKAKNGNRRRKAASSKKTRVSSNGCAGNGRTARKRPTRKNVGDEPGILAKCEEFTLRREPKLGLVVESSRAVESALLESAFGVNARSGKEDRVKLRRALWDLMLLAARRFPGDPDAYRDQLLDDLADTLGSVLLEAYNRTENTTRAHSRPRATNSVVRKAALTVKRALADVETAVEQLARYRYSRPLPGDSPAGWTWILQYTAKDIFRSTRTRPTKAAIRLELEAQGWGFRGHSPESDWERVFRVAGLGNLPSH